LLVDVERDGAENLGELAASDSTEEIHLPQTVLGHDVALSFDHVFHGICADVRDAPVVALDDDVLLEARESDGAVEPGKRAIDEPPESCADGDHNDRGGPK
jgi:hypothetical protein